MSWVVDTCIIIDILDDDATFGQASAHCLESVLDQGLLLCPVSFTELAPAFLGDSGRQVDFLDKVGIEYQVPWIWEDTLKSFKAWARYCELKSRGAIPRRPVADVLIGSYAERFSGLVTRNPADFKNVFPKLKVLVPNLG